MMNLEARFAYRFNLCMACCEMRLGCLHSRMPCIWWHDVLGKPLEHVAYVLLNEAFRNDACSCIATIVASLTLHLEGGDGEMWWRVVCNVVLECYLVDPASSHMLVSKIKPCMCKYEQIQTVKLRMAH